MIQNEIWKIINEFPMYEVSNCGRVRNKNRGNILKGGLDRDGYRQVTLQKNNKQYNRRVCRLVAIEFIPNPENLPQVNHKNEIKSDDNLYNLEWCNEKYNMNYGERPKKNRKNIICVETGQIFNGIRNVERITGIHHSNIRKSCVNGGIAGGYHWKYIDGVK